MEDLLMFSKELVKILLPESYQINLDKPIDCWEQSCPGVTVG